MVKDNFQKYNSEDPNWAKLFSNTFNEKKLTLVCKYF